MFSLNKIHIINSSTDFPVDFFNANNASVGPSVAGTVSMNLIGVGLIDKRKVTITNVRGARATAPVKQVVTIAHSDLTLVIPSVTTEATFVFDTFTTNNEVQWGRDRLRAGSEVAFQVLIGTIGTNAQIRSKSIIDLHNGIVQHNELTEGPFTSTLTTTGGTSPVTGATGIVPSDGSTTASIVLTLRNEHLFIKTLNIVNDNQETSETLVPSVTAIPGSALETTARKEGRNTGALLQENERLLTDVSVRPFGDGQQELPIKSALYAELSFDTLAVRTDMNIGTQSIAGSTNLTSKTNYVLYINETLAGPDVYLSEIAQFLFGNGIDPATGIAYDATDFGDYLLDTNDVATVDAGTYDTTTDLWAA